VIKWYADVGTPQLLLKNEFDQDPTDAGYLPRLAALKQALRDGRRVRVSMNHASGEYFTQIIGGRLKSDRVTAMLPLRPNLTSEALTSNTNAIFGGSIDSSVIIIGAPMSSAAIAPASRSTVRHLLPISRRINQNSWWAD
jgi:hypothetical protein